MTAATQMQLWPTQQAPTLRSRSRARLSRAARTALRQQAWARYDHVKRAAIRMLAQERGGINDRTREAIFAEAEAVARDAARRVFLNAGYRPCPDPLGLGCERLVTPGFAACPNCTMKDE